MKVECLVRVASRFSGARLFNGQCLQQPHPPVEQVLAVAFAFC